MSFNEIEDFFAGVGNKRTPLSGLWREYVNQVCAFMDNGWCCVASWHSGEKIGFTMQSSERIESVHSVDAVDVCLREAASYVGVIVWDDAHTQTVFGNAGVQYEPDGTLYKRLWYQCWQDCDGDKDAAQAMYDDLLRGTHPEIGL